MEKILKQLFVILAIILTLSGCRTAKNNVTLINESDSVIKNATIQVSGESFVFENISPSEKQTFSFTVTQDSDYSVKILFSDGRELSKEELGYVTSGVDLQDVIHIKESDISLETVNRDYHKYGNKVNTPKL